MTPFGLHRSKQKPDELGRRLNHLKPQNQPAKGKSKRRPTNQSVIRAVPWAFTNSRGRWSSNEQLLEPIRHLDVAESFLVIPEDVNNSDIGKHCNNSILTKNIRVFRELARATEVSDAYSWCRGHHHLPSS